MELTRLWLRYRYVVLLDPDRIETALRHSVVFFRNLPAKLHGAEQIR